MYRKNHTQLGKGTVVSHVIMCNQENSQESGETGTEPPALSLSCFPSFFIIIINHYYYNIIISQHVWLKHASQMYV